MDFFEYASVAALFSSIFTGRTELWVAMLVGGLCFAIVYIFQSIGLFIIARREGFKNKWMAFVPFFNTYYIGVCGQKNRFLNMNTKVVALATAIVELLLVGVYILYYVAIFKLQPYIVTIQTTEERYGQLYTVFREDLVAGFNTLYPELGWASWCYYYLQNAIISWLELVYLFLSIVVLSCFFQTYCANHYFLFTITSILFPIQGILIFVVKNNRGVNYAEYTRQVQEQMYNAYRSQQNYGNPYSGGYNYYNQQPNRPPNNGQPPQDGQSNQTPPPSDDPFSEYGSGSSDDNDPFGNMNNK